MSTTFVREIIHRQPASEPFKRRLEPIEILEAAPRAAAKFAAIEESLEDARAVSQRVSEAANDAIHDYRDAEQRLERINEQIRINRADQGHPEFIEATAALKKAERAKARTSQRRDECAERRSAIGSLFEHSLSRYVRTLSPKAVAEYKGASFKPRKGESPAEGVARCREQIDALSVERDGVRTAPRARAEVLKLARAQIERLAAEGQPEFGPLIHHGEPIKFPDQSVRFSVGGHVEGEGGGLVSAIAGGAIPHSVALFAWLHKDALLNRIEKEISAQPEDPAALTVAQREKREAETAAQLLATEREEEAMIEAAEAQGTPILRRPDADPRAVLGLSDAMPAPVKE